MTDHGRGGNRMHGTWTNLKVCSEAQLYRQRLDHTFVWVRSWGTNRHNDTEDCCQRHTKSQSSLPAVKIVTQKSFLPTEIIKKKIKQINSFHLESEYGVCNYCKSSQLMHCDSHIRVYTYSQLFFACDGHFDWPNAWLADWLTDWRTDRRTDGRTDGLTDWRTDDHDWLTVKLSSWLWRWLARLLSGCLGVQLVN